MAGEPVLFAPDYATPGSSIQAVVIGEALTASSLSLQDSHGRTQSRSQGFLWKNPTGGKLATVVLLGVPVNTTAGSYRLVFKAVQGRKEVLLEKALLLTKKEFPEKTIHLDKRMDALYKDSSPEKKEQARIFWAVLGRFNLEADYHRDRFRMPLEEFIPTATFGDIRRYRKPSGAESLSIHFGRDLWAEKGNLVLASGRGRVAMARKRIITGNTVILEHQPGVYSLYYHLDSLMVEEGDIIDTGIAVGTLGETGFATGPHLHWELRIGSVAVNPEFFLEVPLLDTIALTSIMETSP